jgi:PadR family transcriptional regulator PadR
VSSVRVVGRCKQHQLDALAPVDVGIMTGRNLKEKDLRGTALSRCGRAPPWRITLASRVEKVKASGSSRARGGRLTSGCLPTYYLFMSGINSRALDRELKRGSAELLILSLLDARPRHGYDLSKLIETRSGGQLKFHIDSLYPLLYRLEERDWIKGTWVEKPDERRRRFYKLTPEGRRVLAQQRKTWEAFVEAVRRVTGGEHA